MLAIATSSECRAERASRESGPKRHLDFHLQSVAFARLRSTKPSGVLLAGGLLILVSASWAQTFEELVRTNQTGRYVVGEGQVRYLRARGAEVPAPTNQFLGFGDALRTLDLSWAALRFTDAAQFRMKDRTRLEIERQPEQTNQPSLRINEGAIYVTSRGGPQAIPIVTRHAKGVPKGTEFLISVNAKADRTEVTMFDGEVNLQNDFGAVRVPSGWQGVAEAGQAPRLVAVIPARSLVQWWIYYPAILNARELALDPADEIQVSASLAAYRDGDLLNALRRYPGYPDPAMPGKESRKIYLSALFLAVGAVERAQTILTTVDSNAPLARAIHTMIAAVAGSTNNGPQLLADTSSENSGRPLTTSELLALSYTHQATNNLPDALAVARSAVERAPDFSFGWARVAELEFSFGRVRQAQEAVARSLTNALHNAQALALNGFLLAAAFHTREAIASFDQAIAIDPGLGNAWLGRGLCKRRLSFQFPFGDSKSSAPDGSDWLSDLQTAAILEPRRSLLRSYAGKAFGDEGELRLAEKELAYAKHLDTNDPTPWLYSALLKRERNRINESVADLEESIKRNDNRAVYRSRLLLDEDHAVRSSSLAYLYQSAGMDEVALREAAKGVSYDYVDYSAHQFLSESYDALRDPTRFNLRYETVWFNELLLANLLSPVGGTPLSQHISQQEYTRLFERNRIGLSTDSSYRSDGQYREVASQFGVVGSTAWSLDLDYQHNNGVRPNNELDRIEGYVTLKHQIDPEDSVLLLTEHNRYRSGDNYQRFDPAAVRTGLEISEDQPVNVFAGIHRQWAPGIDTLFLAGAVRAEQRIQDTNVPIYVLRERSGTNLSTLAVSSDQHYRSELRFLTAEANQIFQSHRHTFVIGGSVQRGSIEATENTVPIDPFPPVNNTSEATLEHIAAYGYYTWKVVDPLLLTAGVSYDRVTFPENYRLPPLSDRETTRDLVGPKAAFVWLPSQSITVRGAYTKSLGGVTIEETYRLQPAQLAGFVQSFRTIIPESVAGTVSAPIIETAGLALDAKLGNRTYLGVGGDWRSSDVDRQRGVYRRHVSAGPPDPSFTVISSTPESLDYAEHSFSVSINQLLSQTWSVGIGYSLLRSKLHSRLPELPAGTTINGIGNVEDHTERSLLHQPGLLLLFNHPCGIFAGAEVRWILQQNTTTQTGVKLRDEAFPQVDLQAGYRFRRQRGEISVGILNLTDEDYRLSPLTPHVELPHDRVMMARLLLKL